VRHGLLKPACACIRLSCDGRNSPIPFLYGLFTALTAVLHSRGLTSQDKDIAQQAKDGIPKLDAGESSIGGWLLAGLALAILLSDGNGDTSASTPKTSAQIANEVIDDLSEFSHKQAEIAGKRANCLARGKTWYEGAGSLRHAATYLTRLDAADFVHAIDKDTPTCNAFVFCSWGGVVLGRQ